MNSRTFPLYVMITVHLLLATGAAGQEVEPERTIQVTVHLEKYNGKGVSGVAFDVVTSRGAYMDKTDEFGDAVIEAKVAPEEQKVQVRLSRKADFGTGNHMHRLLRTYYFPRRFYGDYDRTMALVESQQEYLPSSLYIVRSK